MRIKIVYYFYSNPKKIICEYKTYLANIKADMKINLSQAELEKTYSLLDTKAINMSVAELLFSTFEETGFFLGAKTPEMFFQKMLEYWGVPESEHEDISLLEKWVKPAIFPLKPDYFTKNLYYQTIKPKSFEDGKYKLEYLSYKPYQPFSLNDIEVDENDHYMERSPIAYFAEEMKYLALTYKGEVWMSIIPNEINTMNPCIAKAKGNVLVLGLGLGYYPFMISEKEEVKEITIVEIDSKIIDIFKKNLLPLFPYKEKIRIIQGDAIKYLDNCSQYDTIFADLWHSPIDGLPLYIQLKKKEHKFKNTIFQYWLEKSLIALYRRCLLTVYAEELEGYIEPDPDKELNKIINSIRVKTKNVTINNYDDINKLISDESILRLIKS